MRFVSDHILLRDQTTSSVMDTLNNSTQCSSTNSDGLEPPQMAEATLTSDTDTVGAGLGIIIDKLRNIETKLDELKTIDSESDAILAAYSFPEVGVTPTANPHTQLDPPLTPSEETSSFRNDTTARSGH